MSARPDASARHDGSDSTRPRVLVRCLHEAATLPAYALPGDAGADLTTIEEVTLAPGQRALVRTGIALGIPDGWVGLVHPRSGLAAKYGVTLVNTPGTIDAGYRGEILLNLLNTDQSTPVTLRAGDRVAQLLLQQVGYAVFEPTDSLPESSRGETGHGSTGGFTGPAQPDPISPKDPM